MKYALIGCGRISTNHIKAAINNNLEIVAICDIVPENMKNILEKHELQNNKSIKNHGNPWNKMSTNVLRIVELFLLFLDHISYVL